MSQHVCKNVLTGHADASESSSLVDAGSLVHAGVGLALVDVDLAPATSETGRAVAPVRARSVHANSAVFARRS